MVYQPNGATATRGNASPGLAQDDGGRSAAFKRRRRPQRWRACSLVAKLPRLPGARESRWMHLLSGPPSAELLAAAPGFTLSGEPKPTRFPEIGALSVPVTFAGAAA